MIKSKTHVKEELVLLLPPNYQPSENEEFMNPYQCEYFRQKLIKWRKDLLEETQNTLGRLQSYNLSQPEAGDRAFVESEHSIDLRTRDRERKLISKIDAALARIEDGTYGYCEDTGEPINLKRLEARPIATLSIEAQKRYEQQEKMRRDN